jgi:glycosyltransferase involved in cell wall biosynthesis
MDNTHQGDDKEFISIVIPIYCEGIYISKLLADIREAMTVVDVVYELILIDDGSTDETWKILVEEAEKVSMLRAVKLSRNFGKELALCAGLELARGGVVIVMDGDGQHPPLLLPKMINIWRETDVDIVEAIKLTRGQETLFSKLSASLFYLIWNRLSGFKLKGASDFKLMSRRSVDAWLQMEESNVFFRGMTAWLGFTRAQITFKVERRMSGESTWSLSRKLRLALNAISSFSTLPLQFITFAGMFFLLFAVIVGTQTLYVFITGNTVNGFATIVFLLLIIGSLLMISLGIIGEYLAKIYIEVKRRPRYIVSQVIETSVNKLKD